MSLRASWDSAKRDVGVSLKALSRLVTSPPPSTLPNLTSGLPESFAQLLQKLHHDVTALSLAFKPPVTEKAAIAQLEKVSESYGRIAACSVAATGGQAGGSLVEEWRDGAVRIGSELLRLLDGFAEAQGHSVAGSSSKEENPYLLHTGLVWDSIDHLSKDMSSSENEAIGKRLRGQSEVIKDAWIEFKEFLEDQASEEGEDDEDSSVRDAESDEDDEDDEFADLEDMMNGGKITKEERLRAERAKPQLGLHQILHATILRYLPVLSLEPEEPYADILNASGAVAAAFDSVIAALYPDQEEDEINATLSDLSSRSRDLAHLVRTRLARSATEGGDVDACGSFLQKWSDRLAKEEDQWVSGALSLSDLGRALPDE